jgi:AcrR family transcriptional regulator
MDARTTILHAAARLLSESPSGEISTRDVCEVAGVGAPALYRHFGDKDGLLAAVVDYGFEQYLSTKRAAIPSENAVQDLRDGWDNHVAFALANPNYYKLMYSPLLTARPDAAAEAHRLLTEVVERAATSGRLMVPVATAAQMIMSANAGVALALLYRPELNTDPQLSVRVRESVLSACITSDQGEGAPPQARTLASTATMLRAQLSASSSSTLSSTESALLGDWLIRLEVKG